MPRDRAPIEETKRDKPMERQNCTMTGRMVGREALITAVAISICAHVKAGSSEPVFGVSPLEFTSQQNTYAKRSLG